MMLKKLILNLRHGKYENRLFLLILALTTIPLLILGVITYYIYMDGELKRNQQKLDSYSEIVSRDYENVCSMIREYYMDASQSEDFKWLLDQKDPPYSDLTEVSRAQKLLQGNYFMSKYISNYDFLSIREGWILSNYGMFEYQTLRNKQEIDAFVEMQKDIPLSVYWLNRKNMTSPYESLQKISRIADTTQELLVIKQEDQMGEIVYLLLIRLNQVELDAMAENYQKLGYEVTVFSNDEVLTQTSQDFTDAYLAGSSERDHVYRSAQRHQYYASRTDTGISGLTCIVGYNLEALRSRGAVFVWMSFLFAGCLALLILLIRYASKMVSRPVIQLQKLVDHQNNQIRELFITTMIKGEVTEKKIQDTLKKMNLTEYPHYRMIGVICKSSLTGKSMEEIKRTELHAAIINAQPSKVWEQFFVMPVLYRNVMLFLVGEENEIDLDRKTAMLYKEIKDEIAETYGYTIAAGVSRSFAELIQLNHAYEECLETLHNKQNQDLTYSSLVLYDDYSLDDHILNTYDIVIENELVNAISGANEEEANHLLDLILERMERRKVTGIERNFYVVRLLTAIIAILDQASIPLGEVFGSEQYNIIVQTSQIYDKNKLLHHIKQEMIHPIAEAITNKNQSGGSEIAKQVIRMIKESKGNITLNECAESLNYHPNYIWKVLKKETGQNFTDLAGNEKLELAKFMLLTTDYAIAEISDKLQYTNVQSFIRFFKSHTETTPASFRKAHKH